MIDLIQLNHPLIQIFLILGLFLSIFLYLKPNNINNKDRIPGKWKPEPSNFPIPPPYPNWNIQSTKPIPYRAFKHKYNVTMAIQNVHPHDWIQLDNEWPKYHRIRLERIKEKGKKLYDTATPEARYAGLELLKELRIYLCARYPNLFKKLKYGIENLYNGEKFEFMKPGFNEDPMLIVGHLLQDDVIILTEDQEGKYWFTGGCVLLAGSWKFKDKFNTSLDNIHLISKVPKYIPNLQKSMMKFFYRITTSEMMVRFNYSFQLDNNLPWAYSSLGDEDDDELKFRFTNNDLNSITIDDVHYRSERQVIRRLPQTGAIAFIVRTYFIPLKEICKEPFVPQRLLNGILAWDEDSKKYKGFYKFKDIVIPYLEEKVKEQEEMGYTRDKEILNYPL